MTLMFSRQLCQILTDLRFKSDQDETWHDCSSMHIDWKETHFRFDVTLSRWRLWRDSTQRSVATWWLNTKRLPAPMQ